MIIKVEIVSLIISVAALVQRQRLPMKDTLIDDYFFVFYKVVIDKFVLTF